MKLHDKYIQLLRDALIGSVNGRRMRECHVRNNIPTRLSTEKETDDGIGWPLDATTMLGRLRMDNIRSCMETILTTPELCADGIDVCEAGVWRGGATIFMKGIIDAMNKTNMKVWVLDSFEGLPPCSPDQFPADTFDFTKYGFLKVSLDDVQTNFKRFGCLDDRVRFVKGFFKDTLYPPPDDMKKLALLRVDADMYEGTIQVLEALYPRVVCGGYVIIDDYGCIAMCRQAVDDFRAKYHITEPMEKIDWTGVMWRKDLESSSS